MSRTQNTLCREIGIWALIPFVTCQKVAGVSPERGDCLSAFCSHFLSFGWFASPLICENKEIYSVFSHSPEFVASELHRHGVKNMVLKSLNCFQRHSSRNVCTLHRPPFRLHRSWLSPQSPLGNGGRCRLAFLIALIFITHGGHKNDLPPSLTLWWII